MTEELSTFSEVLKHKEFDDSPLSIVYYNVLNDLKENDPDNPKKSMKKWYKQVALWATWEAHKTASTDDGTNLLTMVGLPKKQKEFAKLLGVSARTIRNYQQKYSDYAKSSQDATFTRLLARYRLDAVTSLGEAATTKDHPQFAQSQRTFFTLTGDLNTGAKGTEDDPVHSVGMSLDEWREEQAKRRQQAAETAALFNDDDLDTEN